jgi:hypothetical protein
MGESLSPWPALCCRHTPFYGEIPATPPAE